MRQIDSPEIFLNECVCRFFPLNTLMDLNAGNPGGPAWKKDYLAVIVEDDNTYSNIVNPVFQPCD
jgi:hypothetical protein